MKKEKILEYILALMIFAFGFSQIQTIQAKQKPITYITSDDELVEGIYDNLLARNTKFVIGYRGDFEDLDLDNLDELFEKAFMIDDKNTTDDFDYLKGNVKMYQLSAEGTKKLSKLTFTVKYRETAQQLKVVNDYVEESLRELKLGKKSNYQKIKIIHDFIINTTQYDKSYKKYSAYEAINSGKAVCQGYSLLFYKMATEAGVPCRFVTSSTHAWNIVKIGKSWYHIDLTWDDPVSTKPVLLYKYFLFGSKKVDETHTLSREYTTKSFNKSYPISKTDYVK